MVRSVVRTLALSAVLAVAPSAGAQEGEDDAVRAAAQEHFFQGVALMENENWEAALVEFQRSLDRYPTRSALFNSGMCRKALHLYTEALEDFEAWQRLYAAEAPEEHSAQVVAAIESLRGFLGELRIEVEPHGSEIRVDGRPIGCSPPSAPLTVGVGRDDG